MNDDVELSIATEYAVYPAGRDEKDGPFNGEKFRRELLLPRYLKAKERNVDLRVSLDGVMSFGSSFLEEAFGGLIRNENVEKRDLKSRLKLAYSKSGYVRYESAILRYIDRAEKI